MVKQKKLYRNEAEWQDIRVKRSTIKALAIMKINNDLLTYDQAITLLLSKVEGKLQ